MKQVGELRMWILHVLDEDGPGNGVEIMDSVQKHYDWQVQWHKDTHIHPHEGNVKTKRLLPGSIYPMLKKMVSEGLITKQDDGKYNLTENGQIIATNLFEHFKPRNEQVDLENIPVENLLKVMRWQISSMEDMDLQKIAPHKESIELLIERLKKINNR